MHSRNLLLTFFLISLLACATEKEPVIEKIEPKSVLKDNHRQWFNLNGDVKKLSVEAYRAENRFGEVKKMERDDVEAITLYPGSKYNYLSERIINLFGFEPVKEIIYFHKDGFIDKVEQYNFVGEKELIKYFKYDEKRHLTNIDYKELDSSKNELDHIIVHPAEFGSILELQQETGDGVLVKLVENETKIMEVIYADQFGEPYDRFELKYDETFLPKELIAFDEFNEQEGVLSNSFNEDGSLVTSAMSTSEPGLDLHIEISYESKDKLGNWLRALITESGKERQILERSLEYY